MSLKPKSHFVFPLRNFKYVLPEVDRLLNENSIVEIKGFPMKIFCSKDVQFASSVFTQPNLGMTKFPDILPRVKYVMKKKGGFILEGGDEWKKQRSASQRAFKPQLLDNFLACIPPILNKYIEVWKQKMKGQEAFDFFKDLRLFFTELNYKMLFDLDLETHQVIDLEASTFFLDLNFIKTLPLQIPTPDNLKFKSHTKRIHQSFLRAIDNRKKKPLSSDSQDPLGILLSQNYEQDRLIGEMSSIYFGASVMSTTMGWCLYLVGTHPEVEKKLAQESLLSLEKFAFTKEGLSQVPFSAAILKEVLRIFPSSWGFPRYSKEDIEIMGVKIPKKSLLIPLVILTQRDNKLWEDPFAFSPNRFTDKKSEMSPYAYTPFSAGPRSCLGSMLASTMLPLILSSISSQFRLEYYPDTDHGIIPIPDFGFEIHPEGQVKIKLTPNKL